jgi:NADPH2:quinone reductase
MRSPSAVLFLAHPAILAAEHARGAHGSRRLRHETVAPLTPAPPALGLDYGPGGMRAIQISEFGGPEVLELVDLPTPQPGPDEVLIRVTRAGLNFADTHQRHNQYVAKATLPLVPGSEVAGVRQDTGERVIALCGTGGYAEYAIAPANRVWPIPEGVQDAVAVALLVQGLTAWHLHRTAAQLRPGDGVVVHGAAGGTGSLVVQLARPMGAGRVIASASTQDKRDAALALGADVAVDSEPEGLQARLEEANGGPVDVVYEMAGGRSFDESFAALAPFGRIVAYGIATREQNEVRTGKLLRTSRSVVGFWFNHLFERPGMAEEALADLFARAGRGEVRAQIGATYPLADAAQAQVALAERRTTGKLLLDPNAPDGP